MKFLVCLEKWVRAFHSLCNSILETKKYIANNLSFLVPAIQLTVYSEKLLSKLLWKNFSLSQDYIKSTNHKFCTIHFKYPYPKQYSNKERVLQIVVTADN
jgi:hypothetical protein